MAVQVNIRGKFPSVTSQNKRSLTLHVTFFETSYGKSVCDGLGAVVKGSCVTMR